MTGVQNIRALAKARGFRIEKVRSEYLELYLVVKDGTVAFQGDLIDVEMWLRDHKTLERGR